MINPDRRLYGVDIESGSVVLRRMKHSDLIKEIIGTYQKHGWQLRRVLLRPEIRAELETDIPKPDGAQTEEASVDALWFSRPSHEGREAWELRLLAENPFALFETFEKDETEEEREEMRREMEARLREYINKPSLESPVVSRES